MKDTYTIRYTNKLGEKRVARVKAYCSQWAVQTLKALREVETIRSVKESR